MNLSQLRYWPLSWLNDWELDSERLKSLLRAFYAVLIFHDYWSFYRYAKMTSFVGASWLWPVAWMSWLTDAQQVACAGALLIAALFTHTLNLMKPGWVPGKLLGAVLLLELVALANSFGKINHSMHGFVLAAFPLALISFGGKANALNSVKNRLYFWGAQTAFLMTYFLPGVWKLETYISDVSLSNFFEIHPIRNSFSWAQVENFRPAPPGFDWFVSAPVDHLLWLGVIAFEVACIAVPFLPGIQRLWGCALFLFHAAVSFLIDVHFQPASLLALVLLSLHPYKKIR